MWIDLTKWTSYKGSADKDAISSVIVDSLNKLKWMSEVTELHPLDYYY